MNKDTFSWDTFNEHNDLIIKFKPHEVIKQLDVDISMGDYNGEPLVIPTLPVLTDLPCLTSIDDI